jgi:hypothetical protein
MDKRWVLQQHQNKTMLKFQISAFRHAMAMYYNYMKLYVHLVICQVLIQNPSYKCFQHMNGKYNVDVHEISIMSYEQTKQNKKYCCRLDQPSSFANLFVQART